MTHLAKNPFNDTLAELEKSMPAEFVLEVDMHVFKDVGSMDRAFEIRSTVNNMMSRAQVMGYTINISDDWGSYRHLYKFKLGAEGLSRKAQLIESLSELKALPDPTPAV